MTPRLLRVLTTTIGGGGAEKQLLLCVLGLSQRGAVCHVFALRELTGNSRYRALIEQCRAAGVQFHAPRQRGVLFSAAVLLQLVLSVVKNPRGVLWLWGYRAQLVHLVTPVLWGLRTVVSLRDADPRITRAQRWVTRLAVPLTWRYVSNSRRAVEYMQRYVRGVSRKVSVVPNAVEGSWFELADARRVRPVPARIQIGMLGNVRYLKKGYDVALKVAERVSALGLPVHIRIGGSQYTGETNLADEISRRGLSAVVSFEGTIEAPDAFLDSCDAFLLLSRFEGMPNALMEAMALGMPCISTDVGDVAEFRKHSDCVCVVPVLDVAAVADQLRDWLENWRGAEELGRRAHQFAAEQFAVSTMLDRVEAAFGWRDSLQTVVHVTTVAMTLPFLRGLFRHLAAQGIVVHAVAAGEPFLDTFGAEAGVSCHSIALTRSISPLADVRGFWSLYRLFRRIRPDVVHAHTPKAGMLATAAARLARVRGIVYTIHGLPFTAATGFRRRLLKACERVSCGCARRVLCVSRSMLATAHDERLASARKLTVIGEGSVGGIDTDDRFNPARHAEDGRAWRATHGVSADAVVVTFIGRLTRDKGVVELQRAWQIVRRRQPRARLVVVGPLDSTEPEIQAVVSQFSADDTVRVVGLDWNAPPILAASDVLCLPTYREGFPVTLLEAAAMAVPVVATTVPGCVDAVIDGVTGTLVPPRNAGALAEALEAYIEDAPLRAAHGAAARRRAQESFQPEPIWTGTTAVYRQLLRPQGATLYARGFKRVLDVFLSATALVVLAPIFAITAAGVALAMGTPVLFRQARPGLGGRLFTLVKFRSMRVSDQAAQADAERLTAFGRLLRASSLDELPELWNVLKGDMSLVGPRPLLVQYLDRYTPEQGRRHEVRPGITGLAQVNGRNALSWDAKFELDVWYVDHCSFALDLKILALTVWQVFARRGITQAGHATAAEFMGPTR